MAVRGELSTYRSKRRFARTPEPSGRKGRSAASDLSFVVQHHHASHKHYDFRLEWDGVLLSWAVPKGPVPDPAVKRLAMRVEDHPLSYADFEGIIPQGQYGGGTVMVWDRGLWIPEGDPGAGLRKGRLDFTLEGEKLRGRWTMVRTGKEERNGKASWLLIKRTDEYARRGSGDALLEEEDLSVLTGRSMDEIADDKKRVWSSRKKAGGAKAAAPERTDVKASDLPRGRKAPFPTAALPQLATLVKEAPSGDDWLHEIKHDGYRLLCFIRKSRGRQPDVRLLTRKGNDWTAQFERIARAARSLPVQSAILDGEAVVVDENGRSDFQSLQNAIGNGDSHLLFYVFDLLYLDGVDLRAATLTDRKAALSAVLKDASSVLRYSDHVVGGGQAFFDEACRLGLEGIISKRADAPYAEGRTKSWLKTKCSRRQEFVIAGWTAPEGSRSGLGSLVLAVNEDGKLVYAGRVGTGFTSRTLGELSERLAPLERRTPAIDGAPRSARGRAIHWVEPKLVAEVAFSEWTADGSVRHPSFQGLREDKPASEVRREEPSNAPARKSEVAAQSGSKERTRAAKRPRKGTKATPKKESGPTRIGGVTFTHPERVMYPESGITKGEIARYWEAVSPVALPLMAERPLTLIRCPGGVEAPCFLQRHGGKGTPDSVPRVTVRDKKGKAKSEPYLYVADLESLLSLVHVGALELHVWNARVDRLDRPDTIVMDLDPGPDVSWEQVVEGARGMRDLLEEMGLPSWPRVTGGKGLHVVAPIARRTGWEEVAAFTRGLAQLMARTLPERFVAVATKTKREGKIYVDYLRNAAFASAIATFSPRKRSEGTVALPLTWAEVEKAKTPPLLTVREAAAIDWAARDPWKGYGEDARPVTKAMLRAVGVQ